MLQTRTCALTTCGIEFQTDNPRKLHCTRQHATLDRVRRHRTKHRKGGGGGGDNGGGGGESTLFDTITTADARAIYVPDTCYRTPAVDKRKPAVPDSQSQIKPLRAA